MVTGWCRGGDEGPINRFMGESMSDEKMTMDQGVKDREAKPRRPRRNRKTDWLGERLRQLYDSFGQSPVPPEMQQLIDQLGQADPNGGESK
jgi:Anti-sigma factor NepR